MKRRKFVFVSVTVLTLVMYIMYGWNQTLDEKFVDLSSCPACYGQGYCPEIIEQQNLEVSKIKLTGASSLKVMKILNYKNVYFGNSDRDTIVFKKLAHDSELREFDRKICDINNTINCNVSEALDYLVKRHNSDITRIVKQHPSVFTSDGIVCNHTRVLRYLFSKYTLIDDSPYQQHHFLTMLGINFEPLLINAFGHHTKWFPALYGTCGRVIAEEFVGPTLSQLGHVSWLERADYARQLLEMAREFSDSEFRLYLTDVSLDNFAVDAAGKVKVIDAENIILVDSSKEGLDTTENRNNGIGCHDCLSFSIEDLCGHTTADHNYFAVCKGMLSSTAFSRDLPMGLLYSPPSWVKDWYPSLESDIEACAGNTSFKSYHLPRRREAAIHLHSQLVNLIWKALKDS